MPGSWSKKRIFFTFSDLHHNQRQSRTHSLLAFFSRWPKSQHSLRVYEVESEGEIMPFDFPCTFVIAQWKNTIQTFWNTKLSLLSGKLNRLIWPSPCGIFFFQLYFIGTLPLVAICIFITNLAFSLSIQYPLTQWIKGSFLATIQTQHLVFPFHLNFDLKNNC